MANLGIGAQQTGAGLSLGARLRPLASAGPWPRSGRLLATQRERSPRTLSGPWGVPREPSPELHEGFLWRARRYEVTEKVGEAGKAISAVLGSSAPRAFPGFPGFWNGAYAFSRAGSGSESRRANPLKESDARLPNARAEVQDSQRAFAFFPPNHKRPEPPRSPNLGRKSRTRIVPPPREPQIDRPPSRAPSAFLPHPSTLHMVFEESPISLRAASPDRPALLKS